MWVKGTLLHFIVYNGIQKNLISSKVIKQLGLSTTLHPQPYNIRWLPPRQYLYVIQQRRLSYGIHSFKDEVVCDFSPIDFYDIVLGQPYMWKHHVVYESLPHSVIITLGGHLYKIPEVVPTIIEVDIGGHPPVPNSNWLILTVFNSTRFSVMGTFLCNCGFCTLRLS
jgi:hypothetical protein